MKLFTKLAIAFTAIVSVSANAAKPQLEVDVGVLTTENGNVNATLTITNNGNGQQKILAWYTDLEEEHIFKVERDGIEVDFYGPHFKRQAPTEKDFIKLKSGESLNKTFELSSLYDMSETGNYQVTYDVKSFHLFTNKGQLNKAEKMNVDTLTSNSVYLWLEGITSKGASNKGKPGGGSDSGDCIDGTCFTGRCDNGQKTEILSAFNAADQLTNNSVAYLNSHSANNTSARYETWFGAATSSRYNTATAHFNAINDAIDTKPVTFDCSCKKTYYAYVYPTQPYKVYLCKAFWSANEIGTDSRAGTIIHELSHFNAVAGTDDVVYGHSGAQNLADSNPVQALNNADSHEYFAENTPNQN
ncbi:M35 family metallo-endopeptidase [Pseudoalteromonas denitrificans]|uniref:Peptidyl-Lys metalloendopeptidase n=1 Tax=Pseudoalteromonas denitrificans DSM 6059 TaxID=1123010 RepID=A0A1I1Q696_9GAMM|nr:M35 family metallo-endopeptidase [Pseudoalteromonas denitrificans]SFD14743.1 peptidyl-Lys metalloendopeptidase [Pseudoalteromonas denitrificans DSM 6059]